MNFNKTLDAAVRSLRNADMTTPFNELGAPASDLIQALLDTLDAKARESIASRYFPVDEKAPSKADIEAAASTQESPQAFKNSDFGKTPMGTSYGVIDAMVKLSNESVSEHVSRYLIATLTAHTLPADLEANQQTFHGEKFLESLCWKADSDYKWKKERASDTFDLCERIRLAMEDGARETSKGESAGTRNYDFALLRFSEAVVVTKEAKEWKDACLTTYTALTGKSYSAKATAPTASQAKKAIRNPEEMKNALASL